MNKLDKQAFVPALERRLFLCRFIPPHLRFHSLSRVPQDNKVRGSIRRIVSKGISPRVDAWFWSRGRNGAVSGPVKPKTNSVDFSAVSIRCLSKWLVGSKESPHSGKAGVSRRECRGVPPYKSPLRTAFARPSCRLSSASAMAFTPSLAWARKRVQRKHPACPPWQAPRSPRVRSSSRIHGRLRRGSPG